MNPVLKAGWTPRRHGHEGDWAQILRRLGERTEVTPPHPVSLPMGKGTLEFSLRPVQGFLLPWGEGQDEGRFPRFIAPPGAKSSRMREDRTATRVTVSAHMDLQILIADLAA
jgi:hypothetical protein